MGKNKWGAEQILTLLERERMESLLNDTKWMRLVEGLRTLPLRYRVKMLTEDEAWDTAGPLFLPFPGHAYIEGTTIGPVPARAIEWLEIKPVEHRYQGRLVADELVDHAERIERLLESLRIPYSRRGTAIRVTGHTRPN